MIIFPSVVSHQENEEMQEHSSIFLLDTIKMPSKNGWTNPCLVCIDSIVTSIFIVNQGNFTFGSSLFVHVLQEKSAENGQVRQKHFLIQVILK